MFRETEETIFVVGYDENRIFQRKSSKPLLHRRFFTSFYSFGALNNFYAEISMMTGRWHWLYFIWSRGENNFRYGSNFERLCLLNFLSILNCFELAASGTSVILKDIYRIFNSHFKYSNFQLRHSLGPTFFKCIIMYDIILLLLYDIIIYDIISLLFSRAFSFINATFNRNDLSYFRPLQGSRIHNSFKNSKLLI